MDRSIDCGWLLLDEARNGQSERASGTVGGVEVRSMARAILDEGIFLADEINGIIKDSIDEAIVSSQFNHDKVTHWTNGIAEVCMKRLTNLAKPFKYIVTCIIMQKNGAGMITATSCFWDRDTDDGMGWYEGLIGRWPQYAKSFPALRK